MPYWDHVFMSAWAYTSQNLPWPPRIGLCGGQDWELKGCQFQYFSRCSFVAILGGSLEIESWRHLANSVCWFYRGMLPRCKLMLQEPPDILLHENVLGFPHEKMATLLEGDVFLWGVQSKVQSSYFFWNIFRGDVRLNKEQKVMIHWSFALQEMSSSSFWASPKLTRRSVVFLSRDHACTWFWGMEI